MISINRFAPGPENVPVPYAECRTFAFEYSVLREKQLKRGIAVRPSGVLDGEIPLEKQILIKLNTRNLLGGSWDRYNTLEFCIYYVEMVE